MSVIADVKAAILEILEADAAFAAVDKRWAPPTESEDYAQEPESLYFGDVEIVGDNWSALGSGDGTGRRRRTFRLTVFVLVARTGDEPQDPEERAWDLWEAFEEDLRVDLFAGTPDGADSFLRDAGVYQFDDITAFQTTGIWGPQQWAARVEGRVFFNHNV